MLGNNHHKHLTLLHGLDPPSRHHRRAQRGPPGEGGGAHTLLSLPMGHWSHSRGVRPHGLSASPRPTSSSVTWSQVNRRRGMMFRVSQQRISISGTETACSSHPCDFTAPAPRVCFPVLTGDDVLRAPCPHTCSRADCRGDAQS